MAGYGSTLFGQSVGFGTAGAGLSDLQGGYAPVSGVGNSIAFGLTGTDAALSSAAAVGGQFASYEVTGDVLGKLGLSVGVLVDVGGVAYAIMGSDAA